MRRFAAVLVCLLIGTAAASAAERERPRLAVFVSVRMGAISYILTADRPIGREQRQALEAAAEEVGMPVVVPDAHTVSGETFTSLAAADVTTLQPLAHAAGGDVAVLGTLEWDDAARGWRAQWSLAWAGRTHHWQIHQATLDEALRSAVGGAAEIVSGHGEPGD